MKNIKSDFPFGGMLLVSVLGTIGLGLMLFPAIGAIKAKNITIFLNGLILVLFGLIFFIFCSVAWIKFITNVLVKPKIEPLYLFKENIFLNRKGRKIYFNSEDLEKNKFYNVYKTTDYIIEIKGESKEHFELKLKDSFWLNWYSPHGDFKEILLLPILYLFFSIFFFSSIFSPLPYNIVLTLLGIYPLYYIIYDIKKKIEINKKNQETIKKITKSD